MQNRLPFSPHANIQRSDIESVIDPTGGDLIVSMFQSHQIHPN